jgi:micrococcal nuclease
VERKKLIFLGLAVPILIFLFLSMGSGEESTSKMVTRVIDGDTIVVEGGQRIRLLGIDTQEEGEKCYEPAKKRLEELILKRRVEITGNTYDRYGRRLCYVFINGSLVNEKLVREGLAVAFFYDEGKKYRNIIQRAEKAAIEKGIGCEWE